MARYLTRGIACDLMTGAELLVERGSPRKARRGVVVLLALLAGLRVGEIARLTCSAFHGLSGTSLSTLTVPKLKGRGKGRSERTVLIGTRLTDALMHYEERFAGRGPWFFPGRFAHDGSHISTRTVQRDIDSSLDAAGVGEARAHDLRHTYATWLYLASGKDLSFVSRQLGHSDTLTTTIYVGSILEDVEKALTDLYGGV